MPPHVAALDKIVFGDNNKASTQRDDTLFSRYDKLTQDARAYLKDSENYVGTDFESFFDGVEHTNADVSAFVSAIAGTGLGRNDPVAQKLSAYLQLAQDKGGLAPLVEALTRAISDHAAGIREPSVQGALVVAEKKLGALPVVKHSRMGAGEKNGTKTSGSISEPGATDASHGSQGPEVSETNAGGVRRVGSFTRRIQTAARVFTFGTPTEWADRTDALSGFNGYSTVGFSRADTGFMMFVFPAEHMEALEDYIEHRASVGQSITTAERPNVLAFFSALRYVHNNGELEVRAADQGSIGAVVLKRKGLLGETKQKGPGSFSIVHAKGRWLEFRQFQSLKPARPLKTRMDKRSPRHHPEEPLFTPFSSHIL